MNLDLMMHSENSESLSTISPCHSIETFISSWGGYVNSQRWNESRTDYFVKSHKWDKCYFFFFLPTQQQPFCKNKVPFKNNHFCMENPDSETATLMGIANTVCSVFLFLYKKVKLKECNMLHVGLKWLYYKQSEMVLGVAILLTIWCFSCR